MMEHDEFFRKFGRTCVKAAELHWRTSEVEHLSIEDLYQQFKARMMAELAVSAPDLSTLGALVNKP
jgi:hypothetical protein